MLQIKKKKYYNANPEHHSHLMILENSLRTNEHEFRYTINSDGPTCLKNHTRIANEQLLVPYTTPELNRIKEIITMTLQLMILVHNIRDPTCKQLANLMPELIQAAELAG